MAGPHLIEWRNSNEDRYFPFADDVTLISEESIRISPQVFLDAVLYPIDLEGLLYVKQIDAANAAIILADSATLQEKCRADITTSEVLQFVDDLGRHAGKIVKGPQFELLVGEYTFAPAATTFAPSIVFPQNQCGLRGILLEDGTLMTGDVGLEAGAGMVLRIENGTAIAIHAVGVADPPTDIPIGPPITQIGISGTGDSGLTIDRIDNVVRIGHCLTLDDTQVSDDFIIDEAGDVPPRTNTKFGVDSEKDFCDPGGPTPAPPLCASSPSDAIVDHEGFIYVISITDLLNVRPTSQSEEPPSIQGIDLSIINEIVHSLPPRAQEGLVFAFRECQ
jgi:hypothetical protein